MASELKSKCLCGVKNCEGHEMKDGKISIPDHPLGPIEIAEKEPEEKAGTQGK